MTLDFECDSKDMERRTADLIETADEIWSLVASYMPELSDYVDKSEVEQKLDECRTKSLLVIQMVTGICKCEATQALDQVIEREIEKQDKQIDVFNQLFEKS